MHTIKIGSSDACDIKFPEKNATKSVWATIDVHYSLELQLFDESVRCMVNRSDVTYRDRIKYGDEKIR